MLTGGAVPGRTKGLTGPSLADQRLPRDPALPCPAEGGLSVSTGGMERKFCATAGAMIAGAAARAASEPGT